MSGREKLGSRQFFIDGAEVLPPIPPSKSLVSNSHTTRKVSTNAAVAVAIVGVVAAVIKAFPLGTPSGEVGGCADTPALLKLVLDVKDDWLRLDQLKAHQASFPKCPSAQLARTLEVDLHKQLNLRKADVQPAKPPAGPIVAPARTALPPVVVGQPKPQVAAIPRMPITPVVSPIVIGDLFTVAPWIRYDLPRFAGVTLTIRSHTASVQVYMNNEFQFICPQGEDFRVFTRGYSTFQVGTGDDQAELEIVAVEHGDVIPSSSFRASRDT